MKIKESNVDKDTKRARIDAQREKRSDIAKKTWETRKEKESKKNENFYNKGEK